MINFREFLLPITFVMYYNRGQEVNISHFPEGIQVFGRPWGKEIFTSEKE